MTTGVYAWVTDHPTLQLVLSAGCLLLAVLALWRLRQQQRHGRRLSASLRQAMKQREHRRHRDALTGLLQRPEFEQALADALQKADRHGEQLCVLYLDLDNLRAVNDAYGHETGDAVLRDAAQRLQDSLGDNLLASARIAADEFAFVVSGDVVAGRRCAEALAAAAARPARIQGRETRLACSIGIAAYPLHGARPRLLANAALAMRSVKLAGGGGHADYDPQMSVALREQADLLQDLRAAVERRQLALYYQPKIDARSLQVTAAEALIRWRHPQRGLINPSLFIPLAERHGLIGAIGDWVIDEACRQAAQWREAGLRMRVAVNLSGVQLRQDDLVERIEQALQRHRIPAGRFTCEITETVAMEDTQVTRDAFERLRSSGVHVSIDDFGTGHSSLASLRRLPAAELKIDRAFVCDLQTSEDARTIARAIVQMAHTLGLRVVAEGVELEAQRDLLVEMGCDELQGFLFARPMTAAALALWASDDSPGRELPAFRASLFDETRPAPLNG